MKLKTFNEFITENTQKVNRKVQFIKVDPVKSSTDNKIMKKLTEEARDRFYEVFLQEDYKDILIKHQQLKIEHNELKRGNRNNW